MNRDPRRLRLVLTVLVLISFTLITIDYKAGKSGPLGGVRRVLTAVFDPIESGLGHVFRPVGHLFTDLGHAGSNGAKVRSLQRQLADLQARSGQDADVQRQYRELSQLETLSAGHQLKVIPAQVIALGDASQFDYTVTIDVGSADGVQQYQTVVAGSSTGGGLVGRVLTTTARTATVAVIIDPSLLVGARLQRDAELGKVAGHGLAPLTYTPSGTAGTATPQVGDVVETYGSSTYVPGIPIGRVLAGIVISMLLSIGSVLMAHFFRAIYLRPEALELDTGLTVLASVPDMRAIGGPSSGVLVMPG